MTKKDLTSGLWSFLWCALRFHSAPATNSGKKAEWRSAARKSDQRLNSVSSHSDAAPMENGASLRERQDPARIEHRHRTNGIILKYFESPGVTRLMLLRCTKPF